MTVVVLARDLIISTRIADAAERAGQEFLRVDAPADLPAAAAVGVLLVDWGGRDAGWGSALAGWRGSTGDSGPRVILFGPHSDLEAHAAARAAGLGPMMARSRLVAQLDDLVRS